MHASLIRFSCIPVKGNIYLMKPHYIFLESISIHIILKMKKQGTDLL